MFTYVKDQSQKGIVALITSIIVSILLLIITTGAIALMANELRQATDFDNSIKAYYAAESGIEDAIAHIRRDLLIGVDPNKNNCSPYNEDEANLSGDNLVSYTCQVVTTEQQQLTGKLEPEDSVKLDLSGSSSGISSIRIEWNLSGTTDAQNWTTPIPNGFSQYGAGATNYPAVIEATIIQYPDGNFNEADIASNTLVLKPSTGGPASYPWTNVPPPQNVNCSTASVSYACTIQLTGFNPTQNQIVNLHTRYNAAHYRVQALNAFGNPVTIPQTQFIVDVTGKSGDVFRRVRTQLSEPAPSNYVLLTDENICKVLRISQATNQSLSPETACDISN